MIRIINNTDLSVERLLVLYSKELSTVKHLNIECITFDTCCLRIWSFDTLLLEVNENE